MHVLVLGSQGMLGKEFVEYLRKKRHDVTAWNQADLDITDEKAVNDAILALRPSVIINCAAYTAVDTAESEKESAFKINAHALSYIGASAKEVDAFVVHVSTDYVFSGEVREGYREDDTAFAPCNVYGASKLRGEELLIESGCAYAIIRISWLFGIHGKNFVSTMLAQSKDTEALSVVNDQYGKPTYAHDVVCTVTDHFVDMKGRPGIYHLPNEGVCTWYDFAVEIFKSAHIEKHVIPCMSTSFIRPAKRPMYSVLVNTKLPAQRAWREALHEYIKNLHSV
jgi:dTDP-4-dehydrorhamnose reductase